MKAKKWKDAKVILKRLSLTNVSINSATVCEADQPHRMLLTEAISVAFLEEPPEVILHYCTHLLNSFSQKPYCWVGSYVTYP